MVTAFNMGQGAKSIGGGGRSLPFLGVPMEKEVVLNWKCPECTTTRRSVLIPLQGQYTVCPDCAWDYSQLHERGWQCIDRDVVII